MTCSGNGRGPEQARAALDSPPPTCAGRLQRMRPRPHNVGSGTGNNSGLRTACTPYGQAEEGLPATTPFPTQHARAPTKMHYGAKHHWQQQWASMTDPRPRTAPVVDDCDGCTCARCVLCRCCCRYGSEACHDAATVGDTRTPNTGIPLRTTMLANPMARKSKCCISGEAAKFIVCKAAAEHERFCFR